jgi:di/tripeptidase
LATAAAQSPPDAVVKSVVESTKFKAAMAALDKDHDRLVAEIVQLTEIPAPPFKETARARAYLEMLRAHGLTSVEQDAEGNVMGIRRGLGKGPLIAIAAHLDTVFPEGTDVTVKREGTRLAAPGIGDDTRSLAVLLAIIRAMDAAGIQTQSDILFIGDVGEEGLGDLRGMKYLLQKGPYRGRIGMFISMDGAGGGANITHGGVGSKRYRAAFGAPAATATAPSAVSPAFAMGNAMDKLGASGSGVTEDDVHGGRAMAARQNRSRSRAGWRSTCARSRPPSSRS